MEEQKRKVIVGMVLRLVLAAAVFVLTSEASVSGDGDCPRNRCAWYSGGELQMCATECTEIYPDPQTTFHCQCDSSSCWFDLPKID